MPLCTTALYKLFFYTLLNIRNAFEETSYCICVGTGGQRGRLAPNQIVVGQGYLFRPTPNFVKWNYSPVGRGRETRLLTDLALFISNCYTLKLVNKTMLLLLIDYFFLVTTID